MSDRLARRPDANPARLGDVRRTEVLVDEAEVAIFLEDNDECARVLGIPVVRTDQLPAGTYLAEREGLTLAPDGMSGNTGRLVRITVGTGPQLEAGPATTTRLELEPHRLELDPATVIDHTPEEPHR